MGRRWSRRMDKECQGPVGVTVVPEVHSQEFKFYQERKGSMCDLGGAEAGGIGAPSAELHRQDICQKAF